MSEARRGSGAVVEAVASPDLLYYKTTVATMKKKGLFPGLLVSGLLAPLLFKRKRKANRVGLATSRRLSIIVAKGLFAFTTEVPKAAFGFISFIRGAFHYKLSALSEIERQ